ncbi:MAG: hypothetical protein JWN04_4738 [Myxococcaceae bacterium]|nr:hypothetical protein [Myxococcaceae bacterium]
MACGLLLATACSLDGSGTKTELPAIGGGDATAGPSVEAGVPATLDSGAGHDATGTPTGALDGGPHADDGGGLPLVDGGHLHSDAASALRDAGDAATATACEPAGSYALRIDYAVSWGATSFTDAYGVSYPVFAAGSGTLTLLARLTLGDDAKKPEAVLEPCGTTLPDFAGGSIGYLSERYNSYVPSASWNAPTMPSWTVPFSASCATGGCTLQLDNLDALIGAKATGKDPSSNPTLKTVDQDGDGRDAVTYISRGPPELNAANHAYSYLTLGTSARARKLDMVLAMSAALEGAYQSCDMVTGSASASHAEQHAVGCTGVVTGTANEVECDAPTLNLLEMSLPVWSVTSTSFRAVRVPENSCNTVRAALKPYD